MKGRLLSSFFIVVALLFQRSITIKRKSTIEKLDLYVVNLWKRLMWPQLPNIKILQVRYDLVDKTSSVLLTQGYILEIHNLINDLNH